DMGQAPGRDGEAEAVAAPAQRSGRGREAQEEHPDRARQARRSAQTDPGDDVLDRRPGGVRDVRADGRADRARGAQAHRRGRGARGPLRRLAREAVPGAGGPRRHGPAAARAETEAGTAPRGLARRSQAAREGREGSRARPGRRRRAVPLSTETSPARSPGATFVALFIAALVIWFVLRVAEVLILFFLAVLAAVYFSAITDQLARRFLLPRWVRRLCAVVGRVAVLAGAGGWVVPPVIDSTRARLAGLPATPARPSAPGSSARCSRWSCSRRSPRWGGGCCACRTGSRSASSPGSSRSCRSSGPSYPPCCPPCSSSGPAIGCRRWRSRPGAWRCTSSRRTSSPRSSWRRRSRCRPCSRSPACS